MSENPVYLRLRKIYCVVGAAFCRPDLEAGWKEIERLERNLERANAHLAEIEEYGTGEINAAVELRGKLAEAIRERDAERMAKQVMGQDSDRLSRELRDATRERDHLREIINTSGGGKQVLASSLFAVAEERDALQAQLDAAISWRDEAVDVMLGWERMYHAMAVKAKEAQAQLDEARAALTNIRQYASDTISGPVGVIETLGWHHVGWRWVLQRTQAALGTAAGAQEDGK